MEYKMSKQVAEHLNVSVPTVRNYAKALEHAGHEFKTRKHARLWTDKEIRLIEDATDLYNAEDYPLEMCFRYAVIKENEGEEVAQSILERRESHPPVEYNPQLEQVSTDIKLVLEHVKGIKDDLLLPEDTHQVDELQNTLEAVKKERDQYKNELERLKTMSIWQFRKWKHDNQP